jgi:hypothetical protein
LSQNKVVEKGVFRYRFFLALILTTGMAYEILEKILIGFLLALK